MGAYGRMWSRRLDSLRDKIDVAFRAQQRPRLWSLMQLGAEMAITLRPIREDELQRAQELIVESINDLTDRHGFGRVASVRSPAFQLFCLQSDRDGFWIAEDSGEIVGSAFSWVCEDLWFLAELFIAPGRQGTGIGRELLLRALDHADRTAAGTRALITFPFNVVSQALYIRHGMFPRLPIYMYSVERKVLRDRIVDEPLKFRRAEASGPDISLMGGLDRSALGVSREKHHRHLLSNAEMKAYLFHENDDYIGYAYIASTGHVGPVVVRTGKAMAPVLGTALKVASEAETDHVSAFLPGCCEAALEVAATHRMRITLPMVLVANREFGDWRRYLPRNPGFM
jgi:GNAT superfamily N-acetyltransferase